MTTEDRPTRLYRCPGCKKLTRYDRANPFRPFCCAMCKNTDIISWAEEGYRIAGEATDKGGQGSDYDEEDENG